MDYYQLLVKEKRKFLLILRDEKLAKAIAFARISSLIAEDNNISWCEGASFLKKIIRKENDSNEST